MEVIEGNWNRVNEFPAALFLEVWMNGDIANANGTVVGQ